MKRPRVAFVLVSAVASGTERRMAFVYGHLVRRDPTRYRLLVTPYLFDVLTRAGYGLDRLPGVSLLPAPHPLDRKRFADAGWLKNVPRLASLARYRRSMLDLAAREGIDAFQVYLEMVPFLGLFPLARPPLITSLVTHLPKYFDPRRLDCRLLLHAVDRSLRSDCVFSYIADRLGQIGADRSKLSYPRRNTVNHEAFRPEAKELAVSFTSRAMRFKNPHVMLDVVSRVLRAHPGARIFLQGGGPMQAELSRQIQERGWSEQVATGYVADPAPIVNRSLVHAALEEYDNAPNQSLLEGMAAGCGVVATDVGLTRQVVTPDVGRLTSLDPEDVAHQVIHLLDHPDQAEALGRAARERILREHHIDIYLAYLDQLHDLTDLRPIVGGPRPPETADRRRDPMEIV